MEEIECTETKINYFYCTKETTKSMFLYNIKWIETFQGDNIMAKANQV